MNNKGFTLIEVIISSLVICSISLSLAYMLRSGSAMIYASRKDTRDLMMTKSVLEELKAKDFSDLHAYNGATYDGGRGRITVAPSGADLLIISAKENIELSTMRSRY